MNSDNITEKDKEMAQKCVECSLCRRARKKQKGIAFWFVKAIEDSDMTVGERTAEDMVTVRKPGKWILSTVADFLVGRHIPDINSGFRALYREDGLKYLLHKKEDMFHIGGQSICSQKVLL